MENRRYRDGIAKGLGSLQACLAFIASKKPATSIRWRIVMRISPTAITLFLAGVVTMGSVGMARAQSCDELWYERNAIYKRAGFCFKTPRAISTFGNAGCEYDSAGQLPLSRGQRERIARIVRLEQEYGCR
jgi:hypothetical protein